MAKNCLQYYQEMHEKHPDVLLLFRSGDFYEMFNEDAREGARILGIILTHFRNETKTAMAGFPYHALDSYLPRLIRAGKRVAICDLPTNEFNPKNNEDMKLTINNNQNETKNVQNAQVINPTTAADHSGEYVEFEEVKDNPKKKTGGKSKKSSQPYSVTTYTTKKGGTASLLFGFPTQEDAQAVADKCAKSVSATWRYSDTGEKRYALSLGTRYGDTAKTLCDALNAGDKKAIDKACKDSCAIYDKVVAEGMAAREAKKQEREAKKKGQGAGSKGQEKAYTAEDIAKMLKAVAQGKPVPKEIMKYMAA